MSQTIDVEYCNALKKIFKRTVIMDK